jgi:phosphoenolpyruvate synthase/pyruvate phosphate dikinase
MINGEVVTAAFRSSFGHGGLLGHAPAPARECGTGRVVGGSDVASLVLEGEVVMVSGDTGEVTWWAPTTNLKHECRPGI